MPWMSASWKASVPIDAAATWPVIATMPTESMYASAIGVTRFVAPGPEVAMHTPTLPVACAYPVAAWPAPCSWRTRMCRTFVESYSGSYAGRIAPPGMPNTTSAPTSSSERTSALAPVIDSVIRVVLSASVRCEMLGRPTKNPSCGCTKGWRVGVGNSADAPWDEYELSHETHP